MVYLNGEFVAQQDAKISTLDRGFLFGDGVYEVIPVYNRNIFALQHHLQRLGNSLKAIKIQNPLTTTEYVTIFETLLAQNSASNQSIYLQISRGASNQRKHTFTNLTPTVYVRTDELHIRSEAELKQGFKAALQEDIRWKHCNIKSTSLLANVLYASNAQELGVEEIILTQHNNITEGASSNVFILQNGVVKTPPLSTNILAGITREMVLKSCALSDIDVLETEVTVQDILSADEVWISSSTREVMPISKIDDKEFAVAGSIWQQVYNNFQTLKY